MTRDAPAAEGNKSIELVAVMPSSLPVFQGS